MAPKSQRLTKAADFKKLFARGKSAKVSGLLLKVGPSDDGKMHVAVVVSKKVAVKAVDRNRLRRLLIEAIRLSEGNSLRGLNAAFIVLPGCAIKNLEDATRLIKQLFLKLSSQ